MKTFTQLGLILCLFLLYPYSGKSDALPLEMKVAQSLSSGGWTNPATWSNNLVPDDSTFVVINAGHTISLTSNLHSRCESLQIKAGGTLDMGNHNLLVRFMPWAHQLNDAGIDDGGTDPAYTAAPINASWSIEDVTGLNKNWNIFKIDGTLAGSGNILFSLMDDYDNAVSSFGATVTGTGTITNTGSIYYTALGSNINGLKFNSACNLNCYTNLNLITDDGNTFGGASMAAFNFGTINIKGTASMILSASSGSFNNQTNANIVVDNGNLYAGPLTGFTAGIFNSGLINVVNGNLSFPNGSYLQNDGTVNVNGDITGVDNTNIFINGGSIDGAVLSVSGGVFPDGGDLITSYVPNSVIYNGTSAQSVVVPTEYGVPVSYSTLIINNPAGATLAADITVNNSLVVSSGATLTVNPGVTLTHTSVNLVVTGTLTLHSDATGTGSFISPVTTTANVERYIAGSVVPTHGWHFLSSPVDVQAISVFHTEGSGNDFYKWDETTSTWINRTATGGGLNPAFETNFEVGKGYLAANIANSTQTFNGNLNVADVTKSLTYTGAATYAGWNLLGNPFSSALTWNDANWTLTNVDANCQIWNEASASYTVLGANGIIPNGNGFMAHATAPGASLTIPAISRVVNSANWYKNAEQNDRIVLTVNDTEGQTSQSTIIRFDANASAGFDSQFDSYFLAGYAPKFYSQTQLENYALNTLPAITENMSIPLGFVKNDGNLFTIEITENIPGQTIYLTDTKTNQTVSLNDNSYTFTAEDGDNADRFVLHFGVVGVNEKSDDTKIQACYTNRQLYIQNPDQAFQMNIFDVQGRNLQSSIINTTGLYSKALNLPAGVYMVRLQNSGSVNTVKIIVR